MQEPQETQIQSLGQEDPLEEEMATHSTILAWKIPWTEEPGGLQSMGSRTVRHNWVHATPTPAGVKHFNISDLYARQGACLHSLSLPFHWAILLLLLFSSSLHRVKKTDRFSYIGNLSKRRYGTHLLSQTPPKINLWEKCNCSFLLQNYLGNRKTSLSSLQFVDPSLTPQPPPKSKKQHWDR